uniref:EOG090X0143 n=1 Tax=Lynceus sp. MCZ IZ 141354 TaxID=1930659 RepID=A0A9N6WQV7_9CRUS|nr:EOG090X0143 [Lynceus sp. MCZ IZ 141354]
MTCNLVEACGKYLLSFPDSFQRTKIYLDQMMRKKTVLVLDSRYNTMIENAYYFVLPPEVASVEKVKQRPPLHNYVRHLLFNELPLKGGGKKVLNLFRKLKWGTEDEVYYIKCLASAWKVKYLHIRNLAGLVAELSLYQEHVGHCVVDAVLEDIRLLMEFPLPKFNQRRVAMIKYLGELYNYRLIDSAVVFKILYSLITFGVETELDPSDNVMRIRLVCTLLDTCGIYFTSGQAKKRLDFFLTYFQYYYLNKKFSPAWDEDIFPIEIDYQVTDVIKLLRPKLKLFTKLQDVCSAVEEMEKEILSKISGVVDVNPTAQLNAIEEDDEYVESETDSVMSVTEEETEVEAVPATNTCKEDDDFLAAFEQMMSENLQERLKETSKPQTDIAVPYTGRRKTESLGGSLGGELGNALKSTESTETTNKTVPFVVMLKKGNKPQLKTLEVPVESDLALNLINRELAEKLENERFKKLTLDFNERQEEEDLQDLMASGSGAKSSVSFNTNRERKVKFQKGAPDADLIFGAPRKKPT